MSRIGISNVTGNLPMTICGRVPSPDGRSRLSIYTEYGVFDFNYSTTINTAGTE